jgi:hypothetical protein
VDYSTEGATLQVSTKNSITSKNLTLPPTKRGGDTNPKDEDYELKYAQKRQSQMALPRSLTTEY